MSRRLVAALRPFTARPLGLYILAPAAGRPSPLASRLSPLGRRSFCADADAQKAKAAAPADESKAEGFNQEAFELSGEDAATAADPAGSAAGEADADAQKAKAAAIEEKDWENPEHVLGAPELRPPPSWRRGSPGHWVDLEFDRAGLPDDAEGPGALPSPWPDHKQPEMGVLWPHPALDDHRRRGFSLPMRLHGADGSQRAAAGKQLKENRDRMQELWRMSASHGISWDELDQAYVKFAQAGKGQYDKWARVRRREFEDEFGRIDEKDEIMAVEEKAKALKQAERFLQKFTPPDENGKEQDPILRFPTRTKRLQGRIYRNRKKRWLSPWAPGKLTASLQQLVAARMLRRETEERTHGLRDIGR